jgi:hypothetical protein
MEVTLKKAADLARAAAEAAEKVKIEPTIRHSIHAADPDVVALGTRLMESVDTARGLITAQFAIRGLIGEANARSGVDAALTERAMVDALIKRIGGVADTFEAALDAEYDPEVTLAEAKSMLASQAKAERHYAYEKSVILRVATPEQTAQVKKTLAALKRRRSDLTDKVAGINLNTRITLSKETVAVLKAASIIE